MDAESPAPEPLPLADVVVLDLTIARAGPTAVRQLADQGADVIRIEPPDESASGEDRHSPDYLNLHRNKRSLALDLKRPEGRAVLHRLVPHADVLVENLRPPVKARLGFDWPTLSRLNPRLVMGSISGFGQDGPYAERGGVDQIVQGMGGLMSITGLPGQGPVRAGVASSDVTAGLQLAVGLLAALHERARTGRGRYVHTSLLESMIGMLDFQAARFTVAGEVPGQEGNHHPTMRPMGLYPTRDGAINLAAPWGRLWEACCRALGLEECLSDPRFATIRDRARHRDALDRLLAERLLARGTGEWLEALHAVGVPCGPVNDVGQVFADPQVVHLGMAVPVEDPVRGPIRILRNATRIAGHDPAIRRPAPTAGQHSSAILRQFGFRDAEIETLESSGIVQALDATRPARRR
ncbi:MAG: CoA transferase [Deltaproteobacteria bacterium]|nr:CoA transferase [Deltaproteobacteria bacterium]